jgi:2-iminobutanoate/2-iminopropanoate deaminase
MNKQLINPAGGPPPIGPYSPGLRIGQLIFVSGQGPADLNGKVNSACIEDQTASTLENIKRILEAAGASMADVAKTTVHLANLDHFQQFNKVYAQYFPDPKPTRTTIGSQLLGGILVEIDVIAVVEG